MILLLGFVVGVILIPGFALYGIYLMGKQVHDKRKIKTQAK